MLGAEAARAEEREATRLELDAMRRAVEAMEGAVEEGKAAEARLEEELRAAMGRAAEADRARAVLALEMGRAEAACQDQRARLDEEAARLDEGCMRAEAALVAARAKCIEVSRHLVLCLDGWRVLRSEPIQVVGDVSRMWLGREACGTERQAGMHHDMRLSRLYGAVVFEAAGQFDTIVVACDGRAGRQAMRVPVDGMWDVAGNERRCGQVGRRLADGDDERRRLTQGQGEQAGRLR